MEKCRCICHHLRYLATEFQKDMAAKRGFDLTCSHCKEEWDAYYIKKHSNKSKQSL